MDRKPTFLSIATTLILLLQGLPAHANPTYRWVDANGNPVLSDRPPETGIPYTEVGVDTGFRRYPKPIADEKSEPAIQAQASGPPSSMVASANDERSKQIAVVEPQPELCEQAKDNIFKLETFPRMRVRDDDGEVRFMLDDERIEQLTKAQAVRDAHCQ
jgi:hypothetical protein